MSLEEWILFELGLRRDGSHNGAVEREGFVHTDVVHIRHCAAGHQLDRLVDPVLLEYMDLWGVQREGAEKLDLESKQENSPCSG